MGERESRGEKKKICALLFFSEEEPTRSFFCKNMKKLDKKGIHNMITSYPKSGTYLGTNFT